MKIQAKLQSYKQHVEHTLLQWLPSRDDEPEKLHQAMHYAVMNGGKRIRPLLAYTTGEMLNIEPSRLDSIACAVELIHCYSLIHDDLPAMDDDDLRRNQPTVHIAFDEATAILAGDALQTLAFEILATDKHLMPMPPSQVEMITLLAKASGSKGMAGGQALDLAAEHKQLSLPQLENIHNLKTGALIKAAILMPCYASSLIEKQTKQRLARFADCIGLAFQIQDDILDVIGETEAIGKPQGSDIAHEKSTYVSLLGLDQAHTLADKLYSEALEILSSYGEGAEGLRRLAKLIVERQS